MIENIRTRLSEFVQEIPRFLNRQMSKEEASLAVQLRGNDALMKSLRELIELRIRQRASVAEPHDPVACKSIIARDRELQWFLGRLEFIYRSPVNEEKGEPPVS